MVATNAAMTATQDWLPLAQPSALASGFYTIDSEVIRVRAAEHAPTTNPATHAPANGRFVERGIAGTVAAHNSGSTLTEYNPDATAPGSGIPQGGPFTEDLDADSFAITGLVDPVANGDAARKKYVDDEIAAIPPPATPDLVPVLLAGNDAGASQIRNLADPTDPQDAATLVSVNNAISDAIADIPPPTTPNLDTVLGESNDADGFQIKGMGDPTDPQDAATKAYVDENAGGALTSVTVNLTAGQIATLSTVPVQVVAAPGAGNVIVPVGASFQYKAGAEPFATGQPTGLALDPAALAYGFGAAVGFAAVDQVVPGFVADLGPLDQAVAEDVALVLTASADPGVTGSILAASLGDAGTGYAPGDTGTITNPLNGTTATYEIDTVGGGGEVATFTVTGAGTQYKVEAAVPTAVVTGAGDGAFTVDIDTITPLSDGTARLTVLYYVMALA